MEKKYGYNSTGFKTSKELAQRLRQVAKFLEDHESFSVPIGAFISSYDGKLSISMDSKEEFVKAVKIIGDADKHYTDGDYGKLVVSAKWAPIELNISRDKVCKKIVKFECEPLFSNDEVEAL
jgi:hypothetical protein